VTTETLFQLITGLLQVLIWLIIARSFMTWFPNARRNPIVEILYQITDPILLPLQRLVPRIGMIDISPIVAVLILIVLQWWLGLLL